MTQICADEDTSASESRGKAARLCSGLKKLGVGGCAFFLVKGLLWLALPAIIVAWKGCVGTD